MVWSRRCAGASVIRTIRPLALIALVTSASADGLQLSDQATQRAVITGGALSGGQVIRHSVPLAAGQSVTIIAAHHDIDLMVRLLDDDGEVDVEVASDGPDGEVRLRVHATRTGPHAFEVAAGYPRSPAGRYLVSFDEVRNATEADRALAAALRHQSRARRLRSRDAYAEALASARQGLALREKALGPNAVDVARSLLLMGQIHDDQAEFARAEQLYGRARAIVDAVPDRPRLIEAEILDSLARNQITRARFQEGARLVSAALEIRERIAGSDHFLVAASLGTMADLHVATKNVPAARTAADRALAIASRWYGPADLPYGDFSNRVARVELLVGNFAVAETLYRESLDMRQKTVGPETLATAHSLIGLAGVALLSNDNIKAAELFARVLGIREKLLGPEHVELGVPLHSLAQLHYRRRDYSTAITLNARSLALKEKAYGGAHPDIKATLNNLGLVYWRQGDYARAEETFRRSLEMAEQLFGPDNLEVVPPLANLGIIAKETGDYALAENRYQRAVSIQEKHLGRDHPDLIMAVESLGILYRDRGDYAHAAEMFRRALHISETSLGPDHPVVARNLDNIFRLEFATGQWTDASAALERLLAIEEAGMSLNLSIGSERQKLAYFEPRLQNLEETISFHRAQPVDRAETRNLALTTLLQRKGRVLDALADNLSAFRRRSTPEDQAVLDRLVRVTSDLAAVALSPSTKTPVAERQRKVAALTAEREKLEIELHRRSAGYLDPSGPVTLAAVQRAIPADAALLEFSRYAPFDPRASYESGKQFGAPRYVAYVVRQTGETGWKDLGAAEEIDALVERFRSALADPEAHGVVALARQLHQHLVSPLQPFLSDVNHLLISPDGVLNLIPFETLRSVHGRYLVQDHLISYVTTGRDLPRMASPRPVTRRTVVFADPAYGEPSPEQPVRASVGGASGRSLTAAEDLSAVYFPPLAGTATEAKRIQTLFPDVDLRVGTQATERALKDLEAPRILHIATHGFFLQQPDASDPPATSEGTRAPIQNPLLRSGLALAGANLARKRGEDGILTALEAANLDLWGTKLVILSACDTGIGVVRNGEGVYGLRRAFFLAGAETLVMSLWPVSDLISREMMTGYYAGLKEGLGRGAALRRIQLRMMKRKGRAHPFYWASFIQAGQWGSLDDRR